MPTRGGLLAHDKTESEMRDYLNATSLKFLSIDGLYKALIKEKEIPLILNLVTTILLELG